LSTSRLNHHESSRYDIKGKDQKPIWTYLIYVVKQAALLEKVMEGEKERERELQAWAV
jgi:hypothetical protein